MWYTVWRKLSPNTYRFYMAAESFSVAQSTLDTHNLGGVITKTPHSYSTNFVHISTIKTYII